MIQHIHLIEKEESLGRDTAANHTYPNMRDFISSMSNSSRNMLGYVLESANEHRLALLLSFFLLSFSVSKQALAAPDNECWRHYSIAIDTQTIFEFNGSRPTRHSLDGYLAIRPLAKDASVSGELWALQLHNIFQKGNGSELAQEAFLESPFVMEVGVDGLINKFHWPIELTEEQKDRLRGLAYYFQAQKDSFYLKTPKKESDTLGAYLAHYQYDSQNITRSKTEYFLNQEELGAALIQNVNILESETRFKKDDCLYSSISGKENIELSNGSGSYRMQVKQKYVLQLTTKTFSPLLFSLPSSVSEWKLPNINSPAKTPQELLAMRKNLLSQITTPNILDLRPGELGQWLKQFDKVIDSLGAYISDGSLSDAAQMRVLAALGILDTQNSQALLVSLINDTELDETNRFRALRALSNGTSPLQAELASRLTEMLEIGEEFGSASLQSSAIMAIGAVISRREANEYSDALINNLSDHLSANIAVDRQAALIASLGNTMRPEIVGVVTSYAQSSNPRIRANVATSLGQLGGEKAQPVLSRMLHTESEDRPQQAILNALANYQLDSSDINTAANIGLTSSSERTRKEAIALLGNQTHEASQVRTHLKEIMRQESSRKNFGLAARSLVRLNSE